MLTRDKNGCAIITGGIVVEELMRNPQFKDKIAIQKIPFNKKSYYLPFSKKSKISITNQELIWNAIAEVNNDKAQILNFYQKYSEGD